MVSQAALSLDALGPYYLLLSALITIGYQGFFYVIACTCQFDKVTDLAGGTNFVILAAVTFFVNQTFFIRQIFITVCIFVWGFRLSGYLFYRILKTETDARFDDKRTNPIAFLAFWVVQAIWVWVCMLPVMMVNAARGTATEMGVAGWVGFGMFVVGFIIEAIADQQKFAFKNKPENKKANCQIGIWTWSRHPNYFGEIFLWWGIFVMATPDFASDLGQYASILSPITITVLLLFVSGIPMLEYRADEKYGNLGDYLNWKKQTSPLIPMPPSLWTSIPQPVQIFCCLELPLYAYKSHVHDETTAITASAESETASKGRKDRRKVSPTTTSSMSSSRSHSDSKEEQNERSSERDEEESMA